MRTNRLDRVFWESPIAESLHQLIQVQRRESDSNFKKRRFYISRVVAGSHKIIPHPFSVARDELPEKSPSQDPECATGLDVRTT